MKIAAIIPCYKVKNKILPVIKESLKYFDKIICVDDHCPENTYSFIKKKIKNKKLDVYRLKNNLGVGGATKFAIKKAYNKYDILCKIDGDNQFNPRECYKLTTKLINNDYEFIKGNRFLSKKNKKTNPRSRLIFNQIIAVVNKITTGNVHLNDPLNGFFSFRTNIIKKINLNNVSNDFFFETDLLYNCSLNKIKIKEFPINIKYFKKHSNFKPGLEIVNFAIKHLKRFFYRIWFQNFKISLNIISLYIILILLLLTCNFIYSLSIGLDAFILMLLFFQILDFLKNKPA